MLKREQEAARAAGAERGGSRGRGDETPTAHHGPGRGRPPDTSRKPPTR